MLEIIIPDGELWNDITNEFTNLSGRTIQLEHSLVSLSKWESKWRKIFLGPEEKTEEEILDYIRCMTLTPDVDPRLYYCLTNNNIIEINQYIEAPMTATFFSDADNKSKGRRELISAELIYYLMTVYNIPMECETWHLNRLITLIRVCNIKSQPPKKRSQREIMSRNAALNAARKKQFNTRG